MTNELDKAALLPCPFCGSVDVRMHVYGESTPGEPDAFAQCHDCSTTGPNGHDRATATTAWNRRATPQPAQAAQAGRGEADTARLDFIAKHARCDPKMDGHHVWWPTNFKNALRGPTLRAAIDAAMALRKGGV